MLEGVLGSLIDLAAGWNSVKTALEFGGEVSRDALHLLVSLPLHLGAALMLRANLARWRPLLAVFVLALTNEASDLVFENVLSGTLPFGPAAEASLNIHVKLVK